MGEPHSPAASGTAPAAAAAVAVPQQTCTGTDEAMAATKAGLPNTSLATLLQPKSEEEDENVTADLQAPCSGIVGSDAGGTTHRKPIMAPRGPPADAANEDVDSPEEDPDEQAFDNLEDEAAFYRTVDALGGTHESEDDLEADEASVELEVEGEGEEAAIQVEDDVAALPTPAAGAPDILQTLAMAGLGCEEMDL